MKFTVGNLVKPNKKGIGSGFQWKLGIVTSVEDNNLDYTNYQFVWISTELGNFYVYASYIESVQSAPSTRWQRFIFWCNKHKLLFLFLFIILILIRILIRIIL